MIDVLFRGDTIEFECDVGENISGWKIRAELYGKDFSIKKATSNSGGSDNQIKITDALNGKFVICFGKDETKNCSGVATLEIEMETPEGKIYTVYQGKFKFEEAKIDWLTP